MNLDKAAILVKKAALEFDKISNPHLADYDLTSSQFKMLKPELFTATQSCTKI
jgi:hypothetical protein